MKRLVWAAPGSSPGQALWPPGLHRRRRDGRPQGEPGNRNGDRPDLQGYKRWSWHIQVAPKTGDLFFNGVSGYRAAFCLGRNQGEHANRLIIQSLAPVLVESVSEGEDSRAALLASLDHPTANVWVHEPPLNLADWTTLEVHINYRPWLETADAYLRKIDQAVLEGEAAYRTSRYEDRVPLWGVRAPECQQFEIKGAWIAADGSFRVGKALEQRAADIRQQGWS